MEIENNLLDYPPCLICSSLVITPNIKIEHDGDDDDDDQSLITFLLGTLLEIPQNERIYHQEKLTNQQLNNLYCESCTKLIFSAKQIYTKILELTRKFRNIQKQIVEQISNSGDLHPGTSLRTSSSSDHHGLMDFCRNFLNKSKDNFNGFGYPFVVDDILVKTCLLISSSSPKSTECKEEPVDQVKEEPVSENEVEDDDDCELGGEYDEDDDDTQESSGDEDDQSETDSDLEPPPAPKKPSKKIPIKKSPSSSPPKKVNRKSPPSTSPTEPPRKKYKAIPPIKKSKFDLLYPSYPKRSRDPITNKYHCSEPFCSKMYPRKTRLETHIMIQHLQDNNFKCEEPCCGKSYANLEQFKDHVSWHAGIPRWKCEEKVTNFEGGSEQCPEAYFDRRKLNRHVQKVHHFDKPFICELCGKKFNCQDYPTTHKYDKHREKVKQNISKKYVPKSTEVSSNSGHICNYCGKTFKVRINLETHINLAHEQTVGKYECQFCEHRFLMKTIFKQHLWGTHQFSFEGYQPPRKKTKIVEKPYQCEVKGCRLAYQKEATLNKHMEEKHGGDGGKEMGRIIYQLHCKYCGKGFHLKSKLEHHQIAHENKESRPFSCELCGNRFATLPYLKMHRWNIHKTPMEKARKNK